MPKFLEVTDKAAARTAIGATATGSSLMTAASAAAARTSLSAQRQATFDVRDYGAVGDGVADDTAAIHAARDAAGIGGTVFFPKGTYSVGSLSANVADQTWQIEHAELVYSGAGANDLITITAENVAIIGGVLDLSAITPQIDPPSYLSKGISVEADGAVIRDVTINGAPGHGIHVVQSNAATITGCTITDFVFHGIMVQLGPGVGAPTEIHDFLIHGNRLESSWQSYANPIYLRAEEGQYISRARISNNVCVIPRGKYPGFNPAYPNEPGGITLFHAQDCVIEGNTTVNGWAGITTGFLTRATISGNTCRGYRGVGVEASGAISGVTISGNVIDADGAGEYASLYGILSSGTSEFTFEDYTIVGNTIIGSTGTSGQQGIMLTGGGLFTRVTIAGNTIGTGGGTGFFNGVLLSSPTTDVAITGNTIDGTSGNSSRGILFNGQVQTGICITANSFANCARAAFEPAVLGTGVFSNIRFTGNMIRNCGSAIRGDGVTAATNLVMDGASPTTSIQTSAGITTLTRDSTETQLLTGSTTQTVRLPSADVITGRRFTIINSSTGLVTVQSSDGSQVMTIPTGTSSVFVALQATPTTAAHWQGQQANVATISGTETLTGKTLTTPKIDTINNTSGSSWLASATDLVYVSPSGRAGLEVSAPSGTINYLRVNGTSSSSPNLSAVGSGTDINLNLVSKGAGQVKANGVEVVTTTGAQNMTNKSLTAPKLSTGTPASASDTGTTGTVVWDASYIYVCTATNTWKRAAIATW